MKIDTLLPPHALIAHTLFDFNHSDTSCFSDDTTAEPAFIVGFVTLKQVWRWRKKRKRMACGNFSWDRPSGASKSSWVWGHAGAAGELDSATAAAASTLYLEFDCQRLLCWLKSERWHLVSSTFHWNLDIIQQWQLVSESLMYLNNSIIMVAAAAACSGSCLSKNKYYKWHHLRGKHDEIDN